jgi:N-acetylglutamate synthase-like GNAT family acetyltransferase
LNLVTAPGDYRIRRATTDDLDQLVVLWKASALPCDDLEKQFTEFQVAEAPDGKVVGAIAIHIADSEGRIHSEAFADFALSSILRPLLWQRLENVAKNHGLFRLWTVEPAPFWKKDAGFATPTAPPSEIFGRADEPWLTLRLRDPGADPAMLEAQFNMFRDQERAKRAWLLQSASALKVFGTLLTIAIFIFTIVIAYWFFKHRGTQQP